jgi:hypothetical protein
MTPEELCEGWDELDTDERLNALAGVGNDTLAANDYEAVDIGGDDLEGLDSGSTDTTTGAITFDRANVENGDACDAMNTLFHELWHAMEIQDHAFDALSEDEQLNFNEVIEFGGYWNEQDELHQDNLYVVPEHDDAEVFAEHMSDAACDCSDDTPDEPAPPPPEPASTESAVDEDIGDFDWANAVVTDAGWGDGIDPDFEHAVVTTAPASETGGEAEYYEGGHAVPTP